MNRCPLEPQGSNLSLLGFIPSSLKDVMVSKNNILVVWSNYYKDLAEKQLASCCRLLDNSPYDYQVETVEAGTYELPSVIRAYHEKQPFDAYLTLGLLLKGSTHHYEFIFEHVKACFVQFAMNGLLLGDGIIYSPSMDLMVERVNNEERVAEAYRAVDYLLRLKAKL